MSVTITSNKIAPKNNDRMGRIARNLDTTILALTAAAGGFLGLADSIFQPQQLAGKELGIAVALLGAIALHGILQRFTSREIRDDVIDIRQNLADLIALDNSHRAFGRATAHYLEIQELKVKLRDRGNSAFAEVTEKLLAHPFGILEALSEARVTVPEELVPTTLGMVIDAYQSRFDAVSYDDLNFWYERKTLAQRYLHLNIASIRKGYVVTRMFIFHYHQLADVTQRAKMVDVLANQMSVGISWALAIYEDLEPGLPPGPLDFALHAGDRAVSTFRREGEGRFITVFSTGGVVPKNDERVEGLRLLYGALLSELWMVSANFVDKHLGANDPEVVTQLKGDASIHNRRLKASSHKDPEHPIFPFVISAEGEIAPKLEELAKIYQEYVSRRP